MISEISLALELMIRCDQACLDEGFAKGAYAARGDTCDCVTSIPRKQMLSRLLVAPEMLQIDRNQQVSGNFVTEDIPKKFQWQAEFIDEDY